MAEAAEVKIKLTVDSNAKKAADDMKAGLEKVDHAAAKAGKRLDLSFSGNFGSMKKVGLAALGGVGAAALTAGAAMVGVAVASTHAWIEAEKQIESIAGTLTLLDRSSVSFKEMKGFGQDLKDGLEELGMQAGVSSDGLIEAFNNVIERGGKSIEKAKELTEAMAQAGRVIPGGARGLSVAFEQIEMGIVRAKNPIVGMISATGTLKGNAKHVAAEMMKMSPEKQMKLAEEAIMKMGAKMKDVPLNFSAMVTSMKIAWTNFFEAGGEPILKSLTAVTARVYDFVMKNKGQVNAVFADFGSGVGKAVEIGGAFFDEFVKMVKASDEIQKAFKEIYEPLKDVFAYIYENKEVFAKTFLDVFSVVAKIIGDSVRGSMMIIKQIMAMLKSMATMTFMGKPMFGKGAAEMVAGGSLKEARGLAAVGARPGEVGDQAKIAALREEYVKAMKAAGQSEQDAQAMFNASVTRAADDHTDIMNRVSQMQTAAIGGNAAAFAGAWTMASNANDKGAQKYALSFLAGNEKLAVALGEAGPAILGEGFDKMMDALKEFDPATAARIKEARMKATLGELGKSTVNQTFTGPINVKQDFKEQDPDRIIIAFKEKLATAGTSRILARTSGPFGY